MFSCGQFAFCALLDQPNGIHHAYIYITFTTTAAKKARHDEHQHDDPRFPLFARRSDCRPSLGGVRPRPGSGEALEEETKRDITHQLSQDAGHQRGGERQ